MATQADMTAAAMAEDLGDLLDHLAWTDVLKPALLKSKLDIAARLSAAVLGGSVEGEKRPEQLAGMCYGIDTVISEIEKILRKGRSASESLRQEGFTLR